ncbi:SMI1/KNR4 family protein [Nocardia sp. NPDC055029]
MSVGYREAGRPALDAEIDRLAAHLGATLPADYRAYLLERDGGWMEDNDQVVDEVFGVRADIGDGVSIWDKLEVYDGRVPRWLLPVARDSYGNLFALSLRSGDHGTVWFWDHEEEDDDDGHPPTEGNISMIAGGWADFIANLAPR